MKKPGIFSLPLLFPSLPFAIVWCVIFIVILSTECESIWPFSHILKEIGVSPPSLTNADSPCAVIFVIDGRFPVASTHHSLPNFPSWRSGNSLGFLMATPLALVRFSYKKLSGLNHILSSTLALAKAITLTFSTRKVFDYFSFSKSLSGEIDSVRHDIGDFNVVFRGGLPATTGAHFD